MENFKQTPSLDFPQAIQAAATKIIQFRGRSRRSEFWWTILLITVVEVFVLPIIFYTPFTGILIAPLLGLLLELARIPLTFRRLHDTGRSGIWCIIDFLLPLGFIAIAVYDISVYTIYDNSSCDHHIYDTHSMFTDLYLITSILFKYLVLSIVCLVYKVILIVFLCRDSDKFENEYGPSPKYSDVNDQLQ